MGVGGWFSQPDSCPLEMLIGVKGLETGKTEEKLLGDLDSLEQVSVWLG